MAAQKKRNWLETTVLIIGLVLVCFIIGFLAYSALTSQETMPEIKITQQKTEKVDGYYGVLIQAENLGSQTVEDLTIEAVLENGPTKEVSEMRFPFLPGKSSVKGWATFKEDPGALPLNLYVRGYRTP
ncbi:MAG: hypothetical protein V7724_13160 [Sediminicola sp.]